jgi:biopolymer transport protein ExbD
MAHMSLRERRMKRAARQKKGMTLNIVSLIDIFTVLVFFLLLNSTELELLPEAKNIHLPESVAEAKPNETIVVMVSRDQIFVQGQPIARVDDVVKATDTVIPSLKAALTQQLLVPPPGAAAGSPATTATADDNTRAVTIMGDREIPYRLLKKILATCSDADFGKLSLAVLQKVGNKPVSAATPVAGRAP